MSRAGATSVESHIAQLKTVLSSAIARRRTETLGVEDVTAAGRVSAAQILAQHQLPGFDNSQMDGFAVRRCDLEPALTTGSHASPHAVELPISEVVPAGGAASPLAPGTAAAVMTGAPVPVGADLVVPVEKTLRGFESVNAAASSTHLSQVSFRGLCEADLSMGRFIRRAGSDVALGDVLIRPGDLLTGPRLAVAAADGVSEITVYEPMRTLVVTTGAELCAPGERLSPGGLYDANTALLQAVCRDFGHQVSSLRVTTDEPELFLRQFDAALARFSPHLVISAGGISAGAYEVVRQSLIPRGLQVGSVAQQPGGPQAWGLLSSASFTGPVAFIGLPGNPVSCAVSLETLVRPALHALDPRCPAPRPVHVQLGEAVQSPEGVRQYRRVRLEHHGIGPGAESVAFTVGGPSSHLLGHLAQSDALLEIPEASTELAAGTRCTALLLPAASIHEHR